MNNTETLATMDIQDEDKQNPPKKHNTVIDLIFTLLFVELRLNDKRWL
jgi:hypothetical protein